MVGNRLAALVAAAAMVSLVTGCSSQGTSNTTSSGTVDPNGTFTYGTGLGTVLTMDPHVIGLGSFFNVQPAYETLLNVSLNKTGDTQYEPNLATSWSWNADATVLTLHLRKDVKFHDGTPFDAAAAKANIDRARTFAASQVKPILAPITAIDTPDSSTVAISVKPHRGEFIISALAFNAGIMIEPKALADPSLLTKVPDYGTGPFVMKEFVPGQKIAFARFDGYWGPKSRQRLANIVINNYASSPPMVAAFKTGDIDMINGISVTTAEVIELQKLVKQNPTQYQAFSMPSMDSEGLWFNITRPAVSDALVRQAIAYAINIPQIVDTLYPPNYCAVATQQVPPNQPGWVAPSTITSYKYDQAKAKQLLQQAGVKLPLSLSLETFSTGRFPELAQAIQAQLKLVGIDVSVATLPPAGSISAWLTQPYKYDMWYFVTGNATDYLQLLYTGNVESLSNPYYIIQTTPQLQSLGAPLIDQSASQAVRVSAGEQVNKQGMKDLLNLRFCWSDSVLYAKASVTGLSTANIPRLHECRTCTDIVPLARLK